MMQSASPRPINPHLLRWMLFVDGENLTMRAQQLSKEASIKLHVGPYYSTDIFVWLPNYPATERITGLPNLQQHAIRSYYYTSVVGDEDKITSIKTALWNLGFQPEVYKKKKQGDKAKGVDIALTKDLLSHAYRNNYDAAVLVAGDGDYVPLVEEVKRLGKILYLVFFLNNGLNPNLMLASDASYDLADRFIKSWRRTKA
jgi:uncharacterized LabA/DUF88 family protein